MHHHVRAGQPMTFEEAAQLDPDEQPGELDAGKWVPTTKRSWRQGEIAVQVGFHLGLYARAHPAWSVAVGNPGTKLRHNPDTLRGPDVAIVRAEREPTGCGAEGWLEGAPDVAVEVAGDASSHSDLTKRALEYLDAGAKMVWVLDPESERLILYRAPDHVRVLGRDDVLDAGDVLPGFTCKVAKFFQ